MTKIEIIKSVVKQTGVDKEIVAKVIDAYASTSKVCTYRRKYC